MSQFREERIECPGCHRRFPFTIHESINVGLHPEHKDKVLDFSLFKYHCPHCGKSDFVCYPTLYHDPENGIMIQVLWREEDFGQQLPGEARELIEIMGQKNYRRREVLGYRELIEKIHIFAAGLNDFAISLIKTIHRMESPDVQTYFAGVNGQELVFIRMKDDELLSDCVIAEKKLYEMALQYAEQWRKPHAFYEFLRVDELYFYDELVKFFNRKKP